MVKEVKCENTILVRTVSFICPKVSPRIQIQATKQRLYVAVEIDLSDIVAG